MIITVVLHYTCTCYLELNESGVKHHKPINPRIRCNITEHRH